MMNKLLKKLSLNMGWNPSPPAGYEPKNDLERYFWSNQGRFIHKWLHYFEIYDRHLAKFRNRPLRMLEIGVSQGGSLQMWKQYFGPQAHIIGCDLNPRCLDLVEPQIEIMIGDQGDRVFLKKMIDQIGTVDILLDDGGHTMDQQRATFEEMFSMISPHGVYLCEDMHTSYWSDYGGGFRNRKSFIEYTKDLVDDLNAWHSRDAESLKTSDFTRTAHSIHFYDSVVVIEKRPMLPPQHSKTGKKSF